MSKCNKYYVVWAGVNPGIYNSWKECLLQVKGFQRAKYKGFETIQDAETALNEGYTSYYRNSAKKKTTTSVPRPEELTNAIAVDASCLGNPGKMEYRGVWVADGGLIFNVGPLDDGTNNIGEFLAIVHALAWMQQNGLNLTICSDSRNAISWVAQKKCKTKLEPTSRNSKVFELIARAERWLNENPFRTKIVKWETKLWGEIPADFGRK
ncbi:MAG: ribonuclease H family protein [Bacteroidales bacterium]